MKLRWLTIEMLLAIHDDLIKRHGGIPGLRDLGLLESALARPHHLFAYESPDIYDLAAAYGYGIAKNHPFLDGNKRVTLMAIYIFLGLNGLKLVASQQEAVHAITGLAAGDLNEAELCDWIKCKTESR